MVKTQGTPYTQQGMIAPCNMHKVIFYNMNTNMSAATKSDHVSLK